MNNDYKIMTAAKNDNDTTTTNVDFAPVLDELLKVKTTTTDLIASVKKLQTAIAKERKQYAKKGKKTNGVKRAPSGFAKPTTLSKELMDFIGVPEGSLMARTEVTKKITTYIKDHKLQDQKDRRHILPDKKLTKLLKLGKEDVVTYFNLQKYLKVHFPSSSSNQSQTNS